MSVKNNVVGFIKNAAIEAITTTGAAGQSVSVETYASNVTTAGAHTLTLPDGTEFGQLKKINLVVDGGNLTLAITSAVSTSANQIVFGDAGDNATLMWVRNQGSTQTDEPTAYWRIIDAVGVAIS